MNHIDRLIVILLQLQRRSGCKSTSEAGALF